MSKSILMATADLKTVAFSREDVLIKKLNHWKGWLCAAGNENLHVTADGNVFTATCKVGGLLGNVYDYFLKLPTYWIDCTKEACGCGSDMQLRKATKAKHIPVIANLKSESVQLQEFSESDRDQFVMVGPLHDFESNLTCTWDLGRRCNYSCNYCNSSISNNFESHKSKGSLEFAYENLKTAYSRGRKTKFIFTGGEPTINPAFLDLVKKISADGHLVHTQTNGSNRSEYYSELIEYSFIGISVHLEFYNKVRLIKNIESIVQKIKSNRTFQFQWFGVRIMAPPSRVTEAVELYNDLLHLKNELKQDFELLISSVYEKNNENDLQAYDKQELELLNQYA